MIGQTKIYVMYADSADDFRLGMIQQMQKKATELREKEINAKTKWQREVFQVAAHEIEKFVWMLEATSVEPRANQQAWTKKEVKEEVEESV